MAHWAVVLPAERYEEERLFAHDWVRLPAPGPQPGDVALLVADGPLPMLFGLGRVRSDTAADRAPVVYYTHRMLDEPLPAGGLELSGPGVHRLEPSAYAASADEVDPYLRVD